MNIFKKYIFMSLLPLIMAGCKEEIPSNSSSNQNNGDIWLIDKKKVYDGGPGKDGIPSVDNPVKVPVDSIDFLEDDDLVIGFKYDGKIVAYPHAVLDWHEIANDKVNDLHVAMTYCPLTGTASAWDREIDGSVTTFGVSGLLYQNNLIPYDRTTESNWSQMLFQCVNGDLRNKRATTYSVFETEWATWKKMYPNSEVLSTETGYSRSYGTYPYGDYKTDDVVYYPIEFENQAFDRKTRVHVILNGKSMLAFAPEVFEGGTNTIRKDFAGNSYVTVGSNNENFYTSFRLTGDQQGLTFTPVENQLPVVMEDNEGNEWTIFGKATSGPRAGEELELADQMIGYWFALGDFYNVGEIHRQ